jgi:hypothetical protein
MRPKPLLAIWVLGLCLLPGCLSKGPDFNSPCAERQALFCEDFEGVDPKLGGSELVSSPAIDQWWITSDEEQQYLFESFPLSGRTRNNMMLLSGGSYQDGAGSFLYTREIDLRAAKRASLNFNLIYKTEQHWDGLIIFGVDQGLEGVGDPINWTMLTPRGEYPDSVLFQGALIPGFSGNSAGWTHQEVDLSAFLGNKLILGFYFVADDYRAEWGIGLDDIVVDADGGSVAGQLARLSGLPDDALIFPQDFLISPDLPRANPLTETTCAAGGEDLPAFSQRAIIKAVRDTGEEVLVLHPGAGKLCWVRQEEIWIDGDASKLPQIAAGAGAEFLPISRLSHTPILPDPGCLEEGGSALPLQIQTALVEQGKITTLLFEPIQPAGLDPAPDDPRVGSPGDLPALLPDFSPGGELWMGINGITSRCLADWNQPGRVVCQGLSLDVSSAQQVTLCWQGWDLAQSCPIGFVMDPAGTQCIPGSESTGCTPECQPGYSLDLQNRLCLIDSDADSLVKNHDSCPPGYLYNELTGVCQGQEYLHETNCPVGTYFEADRRQCVLLEEDASCPEGSRAVAGSKGCVPQKSNTAPHCAEFDLQFSRPVVTVMNSTRCLKDPKNTNENVSSLKPFDKVEALGLSENREMLVVINPAYQIPCWAPLENFYLDQLDLSVQPIITAGETD